MQEFSTLSADGLSEAVVLAGRDFALAQIKWMRQYTLPMIESVPHELWYVMPGGCATHLAWQVGHLAVAQYGLMLFRQRGRIESDIELMPGWLRKNFGRGSTPSAQDDSKNPTPESLLERLHAIHDESCETVAGLGTESLLLPCDMPYVGYANNLGALLFCPQHESIHAGQIGLLRRLHGLAPMR